MIELRNLGCRCYQQRPNKALTNAARSFEHLRTYSDEYLLTLVKNNDVKAFSTLHDRHSKRLFTLAANKLQTYVDNEK